MSQENVPWPEGEKRPPNTTRKDLSWQVIQVYLSIVVSCIHKCFCHDFFPLVPAWGVKSWLDTLNTRAHKSCLSESVSFQKIAHCYSRSPQHHVTMALTGSRWGIESREEAQSWGKESSKRKKKEEAAHKDDWHGSLNPASWKRYCFFFLSYRFRKSDFVFMSQKPNISAWRQSRTKALSVPLCFHICVWGCENDSLMGHFRIRCSDYWYTVGSHFKMTNITALKQDKVPTRSEGGRK